jgi:hypothetical protein
MQHGAAHLRRTPDCRYGWPMDKERPAYISGTVVRCIRPTPGLRMNGHYSVVEVVHDQIMGPLFRLRHERDQRVMPDAYYPWRFELIK